MADRRERDAQATEELFDWLGVKLSLKMAYNLEANMKVERGHEPIVHACNGLPYALWVDRTTHSLITGYMLAELMFGQKPIMSMEQTITSRMILDWVDEMSQEELLVAQIRQLERRPEDIERAKERLKRHR